MIYVSFKAAQWRRTRISIDLMIYESITATKWR